MTQVKIENVRKVVEYMKREDYQGSLDFCEFLRRPS